MSTETYKETIFGKMIKGEMPCNKVFEDDKILVIKDIHPVAPIHFLIIPKKEIIDLQSITPEDSGIMVDVLRVAQHLAKKYNIEEGYRLVTNCGKGAGQSVFHLHFHFIGGRTLTHGLG